MPKRPLSITIISWFYIAAGVTGIAYHSTELNIHAPFENDAILLIFIRLLAIIGGAFTLRGAHWARWLLLAWIVYHVYLSFFHTFSGGTMHSILLVITIYILFRPKTAEYFRGVKTTQEQQ